MNKVCVKDLFDIKKGRKEKELPSNENKAVRYIQIEDLRSNSNIKYCISNGKNVLANYNDIIIVWDGANAGLVGFGLEGAIGSTLGLLKLKKTINCNSVNTHYIARFLQYTENYIRKNTTGATIPHVSRKILEKIKIPLPNKRVQDKIVKMLRDLEVLINKRKQQIEALSSLKKSIFLDMFGDPQLNDKNWDTGRIGDLAKSTQYGTSKKANDNDGEYPILRMNNITYDGEIDLSELKYIDLDENEIKNHLVYSGELLFNRTNSRELVGKTAVYSGKQPVVFAGYLIKLIPNELANSYFISGYLNSIYGKKVLLNMAKNSIGMSNINAKELRSIPIYIPPIELQDKYAHMVLDIDSKIKLFNKSLEDLENLFKSLMQKAFNGVLFTD